MLGLEDALWCISATSVHPVDLAALSPTNSPPYPQTVRKCCGSRSSTELGFQGTRHTLTEGVTSWQRSTKAGIRNARQKPQIRPGRIAGLLGKQGRVESPVSLIASDESHEKTQLPELGSLRPRSFTTDRLPSVKLYVDQACRRVDRISSWLCQLIRLTSPRRAKRGLSKI